MTRRIPIVCAALLFAAAAFGAEQKERTRPEQPVVREAVSEREAAPLLYALPSLKTNDVATLELRVFQGKYQLIGAKVTLPASVPDGAAVDVLYTHPHELQRLRGIEAETPGKLRFIALIDGRVVADEPFANIEARGKALSLDAAVGQVEWVQSREAPKPRAKADYIIKDPECMSWCDQNLAQCLDWCDPRGSDCNLCYTWYHDCSIPCADICVDPKSESNYVVDTLRQAYVLNTVCRIWTWQYWAKYWEHATWHRVTNCDNSYTDTYVSSTYEWKDCWVNTHVNCSPSNYYSLPSPECK
jgi:hypothetical protein